jgi:chemotaxis protein MotB
VFERASADLRPDILPVLRLVAQAVRLRPGRVSVVGNTCDLPISTARFPSNWELSIARAVNVVHFLEANKVQPESLFAYGMADLNPVVPNDSEQGRHKNRRVEIYVTYARQVPWPRR